MTKKSETTEHQILQSAQQANSAPAADQFVDAGHPEPLAEFFKTTGVNRSMIQPLYHRVGPALKPPPPLDEISRQYYEALAKRIALRYERFTPEEREMAEAFGFAVGKPIRDE